MFILNSYRFGGAPASFYQYAMADGANADINDLGGYHSGGSFTVPAAWNGRKVRAGAGARTSANSSAISAAILKGGSAYDGAAESATSSVAGSNSGVSAHSAPIVVSTGDVFTMSGPVNNTNGSWKYFEVLKNGVRGALVNRATTFAFGTAFTPLEWDNEIYDTHGFFTAGLDPDSFVIPSGGSGLYRVQLNIQATAPGTELGLWLATVGVSGNMEIDNAANGPLNIFSPPLALATGDVVTAQGRCQSATTVAVDANSWMSIDELPSGLKYAIARWTSTQSVASGSTWVTVSPNQENVDVGGWYAGPTDSKFTVPSGTTGRIRVGFFIKSTNNLGSNWVFAIFKNGSEFQEMPYNAGTSAGAECLHACSGIIEVTAGDTFDFRARTAAGSMAIQTQSFVWIEEVPTVAS